MRENRLIITKLKYYNNVLSHFSINIYAALTIRVNSKKYVSSFFDITIFVNRILRVRTITTITNRDIIITITNPNVALYN